MAQPVDEDPRTHGQRVSEAKRAIREGERTLEDVGLLGNQVGEMADKLERIRSRNHFSELVAEMLRAQGGGSGTPAPRRG